MVQVIYKYMYCHVSECASTSNSVRGIFCYMYMYIRWRYIVIMPSTSCGSKVIQITLIYQLNDQPDLLEV